MSAHETGARQQTLAIFELYVGVKFMQYSCVPSTCLLATLITNALATFSETSLGLHFFS